MWLNCRNVWNNYRTSKGLVFFVMQGYKKHMLELSVFTWQSYHIRITYAVSNVKDEFYTVMEEKKRSQFGKAYGIADKESYVQIDQCIRDRMCGHTARIFDSRH